MVAYFRKKIGGKICCKISDCTQEKQTPGSFEMNEPKEAENTLRPQLQIKAILRGQENQNCQRHWFRRNLKISIGPGINSKK